MPASEKIDEVRRRENQLTVWDSQDWSSHPDLAPLNRRHPGTAVSTSAVAVRRAWCGENKWTSSVGIPCDAVLEIVAQAWGKLKERRAQIYERFKPEV